MAPRFKCCLLNLCSNLAEPAQGYGPSWLHTNEDESIIATKNDVTILHLTNSKEILELVSRKLVVIDTLILCPELLLLTPEGTMLEMSYTSQS